MARERMQRAARAVLAWVACDGLGWPVGEVAALLGVSRTAVPRGRERGRALLAAHGWSIDDVLSQRGGTA